MGKATVRQLENVTVVLFSGRITVGDESGVLRDTLIGQFERGHKNILLNLQDATYVDSSGLGELVGCFATITRGGGALKLLYVPKKLRDMLEATRLDSLFELCTDETAAIRSFTASTPTRMSKLLDHFRTP